MLLIVCFGEVVFFFPEISNNAKCSAAVWNSELSKYLTHTQTHTHTHIDTAIRSQGYEAHVPENQSKSITISFDLRLQSGTALFDVIQSSCVPSLSSQPSDDLHYRVFRTVYHSNDTLWFYLSGLECLLAPWKKPRNIVLNSRDRSCDDDDDDDDDAAGTYDFPSDIAEVFIFGDESDVSQPLFLTGHSHLMHWFSGLQIDPVLRTHTHTRKENKQPAFILALLATITNGTLALVDWNAASEVSEIAQGFSHLSVLCALNTLDTRQAP